MANRAGRATGQKAAIGRARQRRQDEAEFGIRPGIARVLGFEDLVVEGPLPEHDVAGCDVFGCELCLEHANRGAA